MCYITGMLLDYLRGITATLHGIEINATITVFFMLICCIPL